MSADLFSEGARLPPQHCPVALRRHPPARQGGEGMSVHTDCAEPERGEGDTGRNRRFWAGWVKWKLFQRVEMGTSGQQCREDCEDRTEEQGSERGRQEKGAGGAAWVGRRPRLLGGSRPLGGEEREHLP